jgi:hypothetical protein
MLRHLLSASPCPLWYLLRCGWGRGKPRLFPLRCSRNTCAYFSFSRIASVIWTVEAAPWLIDFAPPEMRIMS